MGGGGFIYWRYPQIAGFGRVDARGSTNSNITLGLGTSPKNRQYHHWPCIW